MESSFSMLLRDHLDLAFVRKGPKLAVEKLISWERPITSFVKVNTDGASIGNPGISGARGLIRDEIFFPVVKMSSIRVVLGLTASLNLELEKVDVNILA